MAKKVKEDLEEQLVGNDETNDDLDEESRHKGRIIGGIIGGVLAVGILVAGGLYYVYNSDNDKPLDKDAAYEQLLQDLSQDILNSDAIMNILTDSGRRGELSMNVLDTLYGTEVTNENRTEAVEKIKQMLMDKYNMSEQDASYFSEWLVDEYMTAYQDSIKNGDVTYDSLLQTYTDKINQVGDTISNVYDNTDANTIVDELSQQNIAMTQDVLNKFAEQSAYLDTLSQLIANSESEVKNIVDLTGKDTNKVVDESADELKEQLKTLGVLVEDTKDAVDGFVDNPSDFTINKFEELSKQISKVNDNLDLTIEGTNKMITTVQNQNIENQGVLVAKLTAIDTQIKNSYNNVNNAFSGISDELSQQVANIYDLIDLNNKNLGNKIDTLGVNLEDQTIALTTAMITNFNEQADYLKYVDGVLRKSSAELSNLVATGDANSDANVNERTRTLLSQIEATQRDVASTNDSITSILGESDALTNENFSDLTEKLILVNNQINGMINDTQALVTNLHVDETANHTDVIDTLSAMTADLSKKDSNLNKVLTDNFKVTSDTLIAMTNDLDNKSSNLNQMLNNNFDAASEQLSNTEIKLTTGMLDNFKEQSDHLNTINSVINESRETLKSTIDIGNKNSDALVSERAMKLLTELDATQKSVQTAQSVLNTVIDNQTKFNGDQFNKVQESLSAVNMDFNSSLAGVNSLIGALRSDTSTNHKATIDKLTAMNNDLTEKNSALNKLLNNSFDAVSEQLSDAEIKLTKGMLDKFKEQSDHLNTINNVIDESREALKSTIDTGNTKSDALVSERTAELLAELDTTQKNVQTAQGVLNSVIDNQTGFNSEQFKKVQDSLASVNTDFNSSLSDVNSLIGALKNDTSTNHKATIDNLASISEKITETSADTNSTISTMNGAVSNQLSSLQSTILSDNATIKGNLDTVKDTMLSDNATIKDRLNALSTENTSNKDEIIRKQTENTNQLISQYQEQINQLNSRLANMESQMAQVFQFVNNGKAAAASALLTKQVQVPQNATFGQIEQAIRSIDQQVVVGVEQIPGDIVYEYHYHTDASGGNPHTEQSATSGGCYTTGVKHVHTDPCYTIRRWHEHNGSCPGHSVWVDWVPDPYWGWIYDCGDNPLNSSEKVLKCNKNTSTIDSYRPSCGLTDGQIIGAHISYNSRAIIPTSDELQFNNSQGDTVEANASIEDKVVNETESETTNKKK